VAAFGRFCEISLKRCKENKICWVVIHLSYDYLDFYINDKTFINKNVSNYIQISIFWLL